MAKTDMILELSPKKIVPGALTVWSEHTAESDLVMDLKALTFKPGSIEEISAFHVLDHLFPEEIVPALLNWRKCLIEGGKLYMVVDDFEYIARAFVGGDISMDLVNNEYCHPSQHTKEYLTEHLKNAGFREGDVHIWFADVPGKFLKKHYELVLDAIKHD